jgi:repressor LexA
MSDAPQDLTRRQRRVYDLIVSSLQRNGRPPTMREIGSALGITSTNGVRYFLEVLEERGYIERDPGLSRGIRLPRRRPALATIHPLRDTPLRDARENPHFDVPIIGSIAAGSPLLAEENLEGTLTLDASLFAGKSGSFALRVRGDSMKDAGILPGDLVIVRPETAPANGAIVVAYWDGEATVKRFYRRGREITLHPENPSYEDIHIPDSQHDFRVLGTVIGVIRRVT